MKRRNFIKASALSTGGLLLSFNWLLGCKASKEELLTMPDEWFELNSYIKIGENGVVTLMAPNPEIGTNVRTSLPMLIAEELDLDWSKVIVEQAEANQKKYGIQFTGGSMAIKNAWEPLRRIGATARYMLVQTAAKKWNVPAEEITTSNGVLTHKKSGNSITYGEIASSAAEIEIPENIPLKEPKDFKIISTSRKNVDGKKIVTGKPMFGIDYKKEGMLIAMIEHPPAFGLTVKSVDDSEARKMPGIKDVFVFHTLDKNYVQGAFDVTSFYESVAIVGNSTWEVMQAKKKLKIEWKPEGAKTMQVNAWGGSKTVNIPAALESTETHKLAMEAKLRGNNKVVRKDGNPEEAFKKAAKILERTYSAPYLAHNTLEPGNCFAHVTDEKADFYAPIQIPEFMRPSLSHVTGLPVDKINLDIARMGGGFGLRLYGHHLLEVAAISKKMKAPIKLMYTREDEMTYGIYRPTYMAKYRAAFDEKNNLTAFHVSAGGIPESPLHANRFPAGAVDNYLAETWSIDSNISIGAFRAPSSNFIAAAEQSFLDEVSEEMGKDPIDFRLELFERAINNQVGEKNDYDAKRYAEVLKTVKEKAKWGQAVKPGVSRGLAAYFCHNSYVAQVIDLEVKDNEPIIHNVTSVVDCGIVVNPDAATNMTQGAVTDALGVALFGELTFKDGVPQKRNFDAYRMIRMSEAPKKQEVYFVENGVTPTGLGEPPFPPVFAALANALYKATNKRYYHQPFGPQIGKA